MKIIAGLGNPGAKYETTRHNAGFLAIDRLVEDWKAKGPARKDQGELYEASVGGERVLLVKPQTYMNNSGRAIGPLFKFFKLTPDDLIVIHDDLDLKPLSLRVKTGGGTGGHNGLKSLDAHLGAGQNGYHRIRVGIGKPGPQDLIPTVDYVLQQFSDSELEKLDPLLDDVARAAEMILRGEIRVAMNKFNTER
ncbi:MAG: aminoacyl-tRNA hydrolase [Oligoflexia bacterium]|nr:aminoacyl-tRNA hydrolase [Oligoflexia bacterium]